MMRRLLRILFLLALIAGGIDGCQCGARPGLEPVGDAGLPAEVCDGVDNDGDGLIDEEIPDQSCGLGACRRTAPGCQGGLVAPCVPGSPAAEICDGIDNDCDGAVDEHTDLEPFGEPITILRGPIAFATELVATTAGMLAIIGTGSIAGEPENSVLVQPLDPDGQPTGEPIDLGIDRSRGPTSWAREDGTTMLTFYARYGGESRVVSLLIDQAGAAIGQPVRRQPQDRSCGAGEQHGVWTGERFLFAWAENSSAPTLDTEILLDVADADGVSLSGDVLRHTGGDLSSPPHFAVLGETVMMLAGILEPPNFDELLGFYRFDLRGEEIGDLTRLPNPEGFQPLWAQVAPSGDGNFVIVAPNRFASGILWSEISSAGEVLLPLDWIIGADGRYSYAHLAVWPGGGHLIAASVNDDPLDGDGGAVLALDPQGQLTVHYHHHRPDEGYFGWPSVLVREGRVFAIYTTPLVVDESHEVRLVELGCSGAVP